MNIRCIFVLAEVISRWCAQFDMGISKSGKLGVLWKQKLSWSDSFSRKNVDIELQEALHQQLLLCTTCLTKYNFNYKTVSVIKSKLCFFGTPFFFFSKFKVTMHR